MKIILLISSILIFYWKSFLGNKVPVRTIKEGTKINIVSLKCEEILKSYKQRLKTLGSSQDGHVYQAFSPTQQLTVWFKSASEKNLGNLARILRLSCQYPLGILFWRHNIMIAHTTNNKNNILYLVHDMPVYNFYFNFTKKLVTFSLEYKSVLVSIAEEISGRSWELLNLWIKLGEKELGIK